MEVEELTIARLERYCGWRPMSDRDFAMAYMIINYVPPWIRLTMAGFLMD